MNTFALSVTVCLGFLLLSLTVFSLYLGFGPPSKQLQDPFDERNS